MSSCTIRGRRILCISTGLLASALAISAAAYGQTFHGPTAYLSQADSPFATEITGGTVVLETFEDGLLSPAGVSASAGAPFAPGGITDSVDGDDGAIDGSGTGGWSFFSASGAAGITFTFNAMTLGGLPTNAGIVWTDGSGTTLFEAFGSGGTPLGSVGPSSIADGSFAGTTAEDRFFGVTHAAGIQSIRISNTSGGIEVDHLQFGPITTNGTATPTATPTLTSTPGPTNGRADVGPPEIPTLGTGAVLTLAGLLALLAIWRLRTPG